MNQTPAFVDIEGSQEQFNGALAGGCQAVVDLLSLLGNVDVNGAIIRL